MAAPYLHTKFVTTICLLVLRTKYNSLIAPIANNAVEPMGAKQFGTEKQPQRLGRPTHAVELTTTRLEIRAALHS